jgi:hypothetical protein
MNRGQPVLDLAMKTIAVFVPLMPTVVHADSNRVAARSRSGKHWLAIMAGNAMAPSASNPPS